MNFAAEHSSVIDNFDGRTVILTIYFCGVTKKPKSGCSEIEVRLYGWKVALSAVSRLVLYCSVTHSTQFWRQTGPAAHQTTADTRRRQYDRTQYFDIAPGLRQRTVARYVWYTCSNHDRLQVTRDRLGRAVCDANFTELGRQPVRQRTLLITYNMRSYGTPANLYLTSSMITYQHARVLRSTDEPLHQVVCRFQQCG